MRTLMILVPLAVLALASCTSISPGNEEVSATPDEAFQALDDMALDLFTALFPGTDVESPGVAETYGCGGFEGVDDTKVRKTYILSADDVPDPRASLNQAR